MKIKRFIFNQFEENTYLLYKVKERTSADTRENNIGDLMVIDPGNSNREEDNQILEFINENNLNLKYIVNTHFHIDHIIGNHFLKKNFPEAKLAIPKKEKKFYDDPLKPLGIENLFKYIYVEPDIFLEDNNTISLGDYNLKVIEVPGHSEGHILLYDDTDHICFCGDIIFKNSIGRGDLPGGNTELLIKNIKEKVITLDEETILFPGHGPSSIVVNERAYNPFLI